LTSGALPLRDTSRQGTCALVLQGSGPNLQPQTAESWAVGFEASPGSGVKFGGEFYSLDLKNALGTLNPSITSTYLTNPDKYTYNLTATQYAAILATLGNGSVLGVQQPSSNIAIVVDTRISNLNAAHLEGIDFHFSWDKDVGDSHISMGTAGTFQTKALVTNGGVLANKLGAESPRLFASSYLGWSNGGFSAKATVNYSGRFRDAAIDNVGLVETVNPFIMTNLSFGYKFGDSSGALDGLALRLIIDNVFDKQPETIKRVNTNNPSYNNWTLGRVIKLGASFKM
jgi:outer membrane cobalamin receptor